MFATLNIIFSIAILCVTANEVYRSYKEWGK